MPSEKLVKLMEDAKIIYGATDKYEGETAITKYALLQACSEFSETPLKISKRRFPLSEDDLKKANAQAQTIINGIRTDEKEYYDSLKKTTPSETLSDPTPVRESTEITKTWIRPETTNSIARHIYKKGLFLQYAKETFRKIWYGDSFILQVLMYIAATYKVLNVDEAIHLHVAGDTQIGKSDSVKRGLIFIPLRYKSSKKFSAMYLFYGYKDGSIHEDMMLFTDDTQLDPEITGLIRNMLTSWHEGVERGVVRFPDPLTVTIPKHVNLILTAVDSVVQESADGQDESRFLTLVITRTKEDSAEIAKFVQQDKPDVTKDIETLLKIWDYIPQKKITLHKIFEQKGEIREFKRYLTMLKCNAVLHNRTKTNDDDVVDVDRLLTYSKPMIDQKTSGYDRDEKIIIQVLTDNSGSWQSVDNIKDKSGLPLLRVYRAIRGTRGTFQCPAGGLMAKSKALEHDYNSDTRKEMFRIS